MLYLINDSFPDKYERMLARFGRCVRLPASSVIPLPVGAHPDTIVGQVGDEIFISDKDTKAAEALEKAGVSFRTSFHASGEKYPLDCALNFFCAGEYLFCREASLSSCVREYAEKHGYKIVNVSQGYAHCACAVAGGGVISADAGICRKTSARHIATLQISHGHVMLPPYEYGFIGGACGNIDESTVFFFGSLDTHPSGDMIRRFLSERGVCIIEGDGALYDYGGFITISN